MNPDIAILIASCMRLKMIETNFIALIYLLTNS